MPDGIVIAAGVPSAVTIVQFVRSISAAVGLYSSIHSAEADVAVPAQATSLITTSRGFAANGAARAGALNTGNAMPPHRAVMRRMKKSARQNGFVCCIEKCRRDVFYIPTAL